MTTAATEITTESRENGSSASSDAQKKSAILAGIKAAQSRSEITSPRGKGSALKRAYKFVQRRVVAIFFRRAGQLAVKKDQGQNHQGIESVAMIAKLKLRAAQARSQAKEKKKSKYILEPDGAVRITTDLISIILLTYTIFEIPYTLIFLENTCGWDWRVVSNLMADILFMMEIFLNFNTAYYQEETMILVVEHSQITAHYIQGWLIIDVVSSVPIDRLVCAAGQGDGGAFVRTIKALRLLKLARIVKFLRVLRKWEMQSGSKLFSNSVRILKFVLLMMMSAHVCGCMWMLIIDMVGCYMDPDIKDPSAISTSCDCVGEHCERWDWMYRYDPQLAEANGEPSSKYLLSLYFTIITLATVGYGDIIPTNDYERVYAVVLALIGAMVFAFCIGSISNLASEGNRFEMAIETVTRDLIDFMVYRGVPKELQVRVRKQLNHSAKRAPHQVHRCLDLLPRQLRNEVIESVCKESVAGIRWFDDMDEDFRAQLLALMRPITLRPKEYLFKALESANEMYIILRGVLDVWDIDERMVVAKLGEGDVVGEIGLLENALPYRTASVTARTDCEILELQRTDFHQYIKPFYPDAYQAIKDLGEVRLSHLAFSDKLRDKMGRLSARRTATLREWKERFLGTRAAVKRAKEQGIIGNATSNSRNMLTQPRRGARRARALSAFEAREKPGTAPPDESEPDTPSSLEPGTPLSGAVLERQDSSFRGIGRVGSFGSVSHSFRTQPQSLAEVKRDLLSPPPPSGIGSPYSVRTRSASPRTQSSTPLDDKITEEPAEEGAGEEGGAAGHSGNGEEDMSRQAKPEGLWGGGENGDGAEAGAEAMADREGAGLTASAREISMRPLPVGNRRRGNAASLLTVDTGAGARAAGDTCLPGQVEGGPLEKRESDKSEGAGGANAGSNPCHGDTADEPVVLPAPIPPAHHTGLRPLPASVSSPARGSGAPLQGQHGRGSRQAHSQGRGRRSRGGYGSDSSGMSSPSPPRRREQPLAERGGGGEGGGGAGVSAAFEEGFKRLAGQLETMEKRMRKEVQDARVATAREVNSLRDQLQLVKEEVWRLRNQQRKRAATDPAELDLLKMYNYPGASKSPAMSPRSSAGDISPSGSVRSRSQLGDNDDSVLSEFWMGPRSQDSEKRLDPARAKDRDTEDRSWRPHKPATGRRRRSSVGNEGSSLGGAQAGGGGGGLMFNFARGSSAKTAKNLPVQGLGGSPQPAAKAEAKVLSRAGSGR